MIKDGYGNRAMISIYTLSDMLANALDWNSGTFVEYLKGGYSLLSFAGNDISTKQVNTSLSSLHVSNLF